MAYYNKQNDFEKARVSLEKAFDLNKMHARVFLELDQLYKKLGVSQEKRNATFVYPHNLGEGKLPGAQENNANYFLGCAYESLGKLKVAMEFYNKGSVGLDEPAGMMFYNDQPADMIFYQGLAFLKIGYNNIIKDEKVELLFESAILPYIYKKVIYLKEQGLFVEYEIENKGQ
ncbi:hypothetical protein [Clostridium lacusfryxellense]|uniref:hypothetical protein n=1 Tax=Clostridium lacusfryxellense TaxID=205328 RepID=UPI001C0D3605|nr:hypothetical protein [Clostridium lacusfryxellense]MBU3113292.1 hypothetical protein [Clostridium lacusfryxellense]